MRIYHLPLEAADLSFLLSRGFREHFPQTSEILEEWFDRSAENCDQFINISEIDKYIVTCTVCGSFKAGCTSPEGPSIIRLLESAIAHDNRN